MRGELASTVLATPSHTVGERAWLLPEKAHTLDEAITNVRSCSPPATCCKLFVASCGCKTFVAATVCSDIVECNTICSVAKCVTTQWYVQASAASEAQRATPEGQKVTKNLSGGTVRQVSVSPDGKLFSTCGHHGHVVVWNTATVNVVRTLRGYEADKVISCQVWSPDGSLLTTGCDGTLAVWDVQQVQSKSHSRFNAMGMKLGWVSLPRSHGDLTGAIYSLCVFCQQGCGRRPQVHWCTFWITIVLSLEFQWRGTMIVHA